MNSIISTLAKFGFLIISCYFAMPMLYLILVAEVQPYVKIIGSILIMAAYLAFIFGMKRAHTKQRYREFESRYKEVVSGAFAENRKSYDMLLQTISHYERNEFKEAHKLLSGLVLCCNNAKDYVAVYMLRALCYTDQGRYELAVSEYKQALQYDGENSLVWSNMGVQLVSMGKLREAGEAYANALRFDPKNVLAHVNMSHHCIRMRENESALRHALTAYELNPNSEEAAAAVALAYTKLGDTVNATKFHKIRDSLK